VEYIYYNIRAVPMSWDGPFFMGIVHQLPRWFTSACFFSVDVESRTC